MSTATLDPPPPLCGVRTSISINYMKTWAGTGLRVVVGEVEWTNLGVTFGLRAFKDILQGNNGGGICGVVLHAGMSSRRRSIMAE
jgi:hypothetical protein